MNSDLNGAQEQRISWMLIEAAKKALTRIITMDTQGKLEKWRHRDALLLHAFENAINKKCKQIIEAGQAKKSEFVSELSKKELRAKARKELTDELKKAREKLRIVRWQITDAEKTAHALVDQKAKDLRKIWEDKLRSARLKLISLKKLCEETSIEWVIKAKSTDPDMYLSGRYPSIPIPMFTPSKDGEGLPMTAGIYFLLKEDVIEYVGQAINISNRLRLGSHHILREDHEIAIVPIERKELTWAECYYIGITKPMLNFGKRARHYEEKEVVEEPV